MGMRAFAGDSLAKGLGFVYKPMMGFKEAEESFLIFCAAHQAKGATERNCASTQTS